MADIPPRPQPVSGRLGSWSVYLRRRLHDRGTLITGTTVAADMGPESFFHVAVKTTDLQTSEAFYRDHFDGDVVDRGEAADGEGATAVNHVALAVADKLVYLFDEAPYEAAGLVEAAPPGSSTTASSFPTSTAPMLT